MQMVTKAEGIQVWPTGSDSVLAAGGNRLPDYSFIGRYMLSVAKLYCVYELSSMQNLL